NLRVLGRPVKWYSYAATQLNLFFAPRNYIRDTWERSELARQWANTGRVVDAAGGAIDGTQLGRRILNYTLNPSNAMGVMQATGRYAFRKGMNSSSREARMLDEMLTLGGASVWGDRFATDRTQFVEGVLRQKGWRKGRKQAAQVIDAYNRTFDLSPALAVYMAARDMGATPEAAGALSLDTINFRKRGASMGLFSSIYAFAQPAITGGANAITSVWSPRSGWNRRGVTRLMGTTLAFAAIQAFARSLADDD